MCSKVRYTGRKVAKRNLIHAHGAKTGMNVYQCDCGWWHWGHATAKQRKGWRIRDRQLV